MDAPLISALLAWALQYVQQYGPIGILVLVLGFLLYIEKREHWKTRKELAECQKQVVDLLREVLPVLKASTMTRAEKTTEDRKLTAAIRYLAARVGLPKANNPS